MSSRRVLLLAMLFLVPAAVPAGASATASVRLDRPCYQDNGTTTKATFYAEGLTPGSVVPVTNRAMSPARNTMAAAASSTEPMRPVGVGS